MRIYSPYRQDLVLMVKLLARLKEEEMRLGKPIKILIWVVAVVVLLLLAAAVTVKLVFTKEKLMAMVRPRVKSAIHRDVTLGDVGLSLWPGIGIRVDDLTVTNQEGFGPEPFVQLDRFLLKVKLLPLLSRRVEISQIVLLRPQISIEVDERGKINFSDLLEKKPRGVEGKPREGKRLFLPISFDRFKIEGGRATYSDRQRGMGIILREIDQEMNLSLKEGFQMIKTQGKLSIGDLSFQPPGGQRPMEGFSFSLDHLLNADLAQSSLHIERLAVAMNKISLILNGKVANFNQVPEVDLNFSGDISIGDVLAALPADMAPQMRDIHASGWVKIEGTTRGLAQIDPPPQTKGRIELRDISVKSARLPQPFRVSRGEIGFTDHSLDIPWLQAKFGEIPLELRTRMEDFKALWVEGGLRMELDLGMVREFVPLPQGMAVSGRVKIAASAQGKAKQPEQMTLSGRVSWEEVEARTPALPVPAKLSGEADLVGTEVILSQMKVDMGGSPMSFSGKVSNLPQWLLAKGDLWATLRGEIDLGVIGELGSLPPDNSISGRLVVDGEAKGRPEELTSMALSGEAELKGVTVVTPSLAKPVEKLEGSVALAGSDLILSGLSMHIGRSSLTIKGRLNDLLPLVLADSKGSVRPSLSFEVSSPLLNLDELLPEREKGGKKTINKRGVTSPPQIDMTGKVSLNRVIFQRIELTDFNANIEVKERAIRIEDARTRVYSGSLGGNVSLDLKDPETPAFSIDLRADRLQANDFLSTLTSFDDHLFGQLDMNASFEGRGAEAEAVKRSLRAQGTSVISGGRLENWDFLNRLAGWLKLPQFKSLELRTLRNSFRVENQRLWLDDLSAQGKEADWLLSGSMGFDGSLDYRVMATLSPGLSNRFNAVGELSQYFKNDQGRVVLNFQVKGTGQSPRFTLDTSQAEQQMKDRLKKEADEKIEELKKKGKDLLKDLLGK